MADLIALELLAEGAVAWNSSRLRDGGEPASLDGLVLPLGAAAASLDDPYDFWLEGVNFSWCSLVAARCEDGVMARADFSHADLTGAVFIRCNLAGAAFCGANLTRTSFVGSSLALADFAGARMGSSTFSRVDLSMALGLSSVEHRSRSVVDAAAMSMTSKSMSTMDSGVATDVRRFLEASGTRPAYDEFTNTSQNTRFGQN